MYRKKIPEDLDCGLILANKVLGGKWKPCIIDSINMGIHRPGEIQRSIPTAPARVIKMQLRELELYGVVFKTIYSAVPARVEYFLTDAGKELLPLIALMDSWGIRHKEMVVQAEDILQQTETVLP